jgi:hypothetical protein
MTEMRVHRLLAKISGDGCARGGTGSILAVSPRTIITTSRCRGNLAARPRRGHFRPTVQPSRKRAGMLRERGVPVRPHRTSLELGPMTMTRDPTAATILAARGQERPKANIFECRACGSALSEERALAGTQRDEAFLHRSDVPSAAVRKPAAGEKNGCSLLLLIMGRAGALQSR